MNLSEFLQEVPLFLNLNEVYARSDGLTNTDGTNFDVEISRLNPDGTYTYSGVFGFSQGSAHRDRPSLQDILYCVQSDCATGEDDLAEFLFDYGYVDTIAGLRRGLIAFEAIKRMRQQMQELLGEEYDLFLEAELDN